MYIQYEYLYYIYKTLENIFQIKKTHCFEI